MTQLFENFIEQRENPSKASTVAESKLANFSNIGAWLLSAEYSSRNVCLVKS